MIQSKSYETITNRSVADNYGSNISTASFSITTEFSNFTNKTIYIKSQSNVPIAIEPVNGSLMTTHQKPCVVVRTIYHIKSSKSFDVTKQLMDNMMLNEVYMSSAAEAMYARMSNAIEVDPRAISHNNFSFALKYEVDAEDIAQASLLHLKESDVMLSFDRAMIIKPHPNSTEGFQQHEVEQNVQYYGQAGVFVRVIDNEMKFPSWFFYSAKQVIEVPPGQDKTKDSGVYVTIATREQKSLKISTEYLSFEEAKEKIGLFTTYEEALTFGDPSRLHEIDELRFNKEITFLKRELEQAKVESERAKQNNIQLKEILDANARFREDSFNYRKLEREDEFSERSKVRQDKTEKRKEKTEKRKEKTEKSKYKVEKKTAKLKWTSEVIKYAPAIILGGLAAYNIYQSRSSSSFTRPATRNYHLN